MMQLEEELAQLVRYAPDPPPVDRVRARARKRRRRRLCARASAGVLAVVTAASLFMILRGSRPTKVSVSGSLATTVVSLYGTAFNVDAPGYSLGDPILQASVALDRTPFPGPVVIIAKRTPLPARPTDTAIYETADGHELFALHTDPGGDQLFGTWDHWTVAVTVDRLSGDERARLASLLRFGARDGYLVLKPVAPLRLVSSVGIEIILSDVWIDSSTYPHGCPTPRESTEHTGEGFTVRRFASHAIWCDRNARVVVWVRIPDTNALIDALRVTRLR